MTARSLFRIALAATMFGGFCPRSGRALEAASGAATPVVADTTLATTTAPPWNPPAPVDPTETWETIARTPGIILSLPLVGVGWIAKSSLNYVENHAVLPHLQALISLQGHTGFSPTAAAFGDRVGLAAGIRFQPPAISWLDVGFAASTGQYNLTRVGFGPRILRLEYQSAWRSKDQFFGLGLDAEKSAVSTYASQSQQAQLHFEKNSAARSLRNPRVQTSAWVGERDLVLLDGRDPVKPGIAEVHPVLASQLLGTHVEHLTYGGFLALDERNGAPHWTHGYRLSTRVDRFDKPIEGFVFNNAQMKGEQFLRFTYEAQGGLSFWRDARTLRLGVRVVDQQIDPSVGVFILPDLARLGGRDGLVGFEPGRFQSTDAAVSRLAYIFPLGRYVEMDAHTELGGVYSHLHDLTFSTLENSYGMTMRIRSLTGLLGAFGFNWSRESVRFGFQIGGEE
jgi:hypothetical protein